MVSVEVLRATPYFAAVSNERLRLVAAIAEERAFEAGDILFEETESATGILIVQEGEIDIVYALPDGKQCVVDTVVRGDLIGWSTLVEPFRRTATAAARTPANCIFIDAAGIRRLCEEDHTLGYRLMQKLAETLSRRLRGALVQIAASE